MEETCESTWCLFANVAEPEYGVEFHIPHRHDTTSTRDNILPAKRHPKRDISALREKGQGILPHKWDHCRT